MRRRLYDLILRHQIYLDEYKAAQVREWQKCIPGLVKDLRKEFSSINYTSLDEMTKKEFNEFKRNVGKVVGYTFNFWQNALLKELEEFSKVDNDLQRAIIANYLAQPDETSKELVPIETIDKPREVDEVLIANIPTEGKKRELRPLLWVYLLSEIMAATGMSAKEAIHKLGADAVTKVNTEINMAWANKETFKELEIAIIGTKELKYTNGKLASINRNVISVIETIIQSFSVTIQTSITSRFFKKWQWKSILDSRICEACAFLHNKIFIYGFGPACPAHMKCRCSKIPFFGPMPDEISAAAWKLEQPQSVRTDFLKSTYLTLDEYAAKLSNIVTR